METYPIPSRTGERWLTWHNSVLPPFPSVGTVIVLLCFGMFGHIAKALRVVFVVAAVAIAGGNIAREISKRRSGGVDDGSPPPPYTYLPVHTDEESAGSYSHDASFVDGFNLAAVEESKGGVDEDFDGDDDVTTATL